MSAHLNDLDGRIRPLVFELIARSAERGIPLVIINTLRTPEQQAANVAKGVSWTSNSKHLPQPPDGKSLAIDVAPYSQFQEHGEHKIQWDAADPSWSIIGAIGEALGLRWGGRWAQRDMGHFEYVTTTAPTTSA